MRWLRREPPLVLHVIILAFMMFALILHVCADESLTCPRGQNPGADHGREGDVKIVVLKCTRSGDGSIASESGIKRCKKGERWFVWLDEENDQRILAKCYR